MAKLAELIGAVNKTSKKIIGGVGLVIPDPDRLPSGIFALDLAIGGGIPLGRCTVVYGLEASLKTTLALKLIAQHQVQFPDRGCVFIDVEGHLIQSWAEVFGVQWDKLLYIRPDSAEQVVNLMEGMMVADDVGLLVLDSIAALVSQRELDADAETANVGTAGLLINKLYRKMTHSFSEASRTAVMPTVILINQIRYKMAVMFGDPETMPGGPAVKFLSSLTLRLSGYDEYEKKTDKLPIYKKVHVVVKKNKVPILAKNCEFMVALRDIPELALKLGGSYDWNTVLLYLKKLALLVQVKDGWELQPIGKGIKIIYPTQEALKQRYQTEQPFAAQLRQGVITHALTQGDPVEDDA